MINMLDPDQRARARDLASRRWHSNGTCEMADILGAAIDYIEELEAERDQLEAAQSAMERIDRVCETIDGRLDKHEIVTLRALLPTEAEREALEWLVAYSGSDTYLKTMRTALAYLDRLLGGGR